MCKLVKKTRAILQPANFDWCICGGFAIDLFHGAETRKHIDVDVCAFWENRNDIIMFMKNKGWTVYEPCGNDKIHLISDINDQKILKNNIFCVKTGNTSFHVTDLGDDMFNCTIDRVEPNDLDFLEFLFNRRDNDNFIYGRNPDIKRGLSKAIFRSGNIPYLSPEITLLYKSTNTDNADYQHDFDITFNKMDAESKMWLIDSLKVCFPQGHKWLQWVKE